MILLIKSLSLVILAFSTVDHPVFMVLHPILPSKIIFRGVFHPHSYCRTCGFPVDISLGTS